MKHILLSIFCLCLFLASCANDNVSPITKKGGSVILNIDNVIGSQNLEFDKTYSIASGEKYTIKKLKYYLSNIQFMKSDGSVTTLQQDSSYFLVDESNSTSMILSLPQVEIGKYLAIRFMIGVDSAKSMAPLEKRRGVLDMSGLGQDMYWTWNQGYIFFKMEGIYTDFSGKNDDYTIGKLVEKYLYYMFGKEIYYVSFKKEHPHDTHCLIHFAYKNKVEVGKIIHDLTKVTEEVIRIYDKIEQSFRS